MKWVYAYTFILILRQIGLNVRWWLGVWIIDFHKISTTLPQNLPISFFSCFLFRFEFLFRSQIKELTESITTDVDEISLENWWRITSKTYAMHAVAVMCCDVQISVAHVQLKKRWGIKTAFCRKKNCTSSMQHSVSATYHKWNVKCANCLRLVNSSQMGLCLFSVNAQKPYFIPNKGDNIANCNAHKLQRTSILSAQ